MGWMARSLTLVRMAVLRRTGSKFLLGSTRRARFGHSHLICLGFSDISIKFQHPKEPLAVYLCISYLMVPSAIQSGS